MQGRSSLCVVLQPLAVLRDLFWRMGRRAGGGRAAPKLQSRAFVLVPVVQDVCPPTRQAGASQGAEGALGISQLLCLCLVHEQREKLHVP